MSIPGRTEAAALLLSVDPSPRLVRHSRAVAEVAAWLAARIGGNGTRVDRRLVESAALLHDVDKAFPKDHQLRRLPHGEGSAAWVGERGHPELADVVANHPVTCLAADDPPLDGGWSGFESIEAAIVSYADKRARQRLIPMSQRFAIWHRKYRLAPAGSVHAWSEDRVAQTTARAERLEADVCRAAGIEPDQVGRLRWTSRALAEARKGGHRR
jgi:putative nucleotidyltransferase with HDIG domain